MAACINVVDGLRSIYYWKGEVGEDDETLLIIKSRRDKLDGLMRHIREGHPYKVPKIIALLIVGGFSDYFRWIDEALDRS